MVTVTIVRFLSIVLCLLCFKWRHLANLILYLECLIRIFALFIPVNQMESKTSLQHGQEFGLLFFIYYCDKRAHIFALIATLTVVVFLPQSVVYMSALTWGEAVVNVLTIIVVFTGMIMSGMVLIYISRLHCQLEVCNEENVKLLNGMHEGLLIFNEQTDCN